MRLQRLARGIKESSAYLDAFCDRVSQFSLLQGGTGWVTEVVWSHYASRSPALGAWVALSEDDVIAGHAVGLIQVYDGRWIGWIYQVEMDSVPRHWEFRKAFMEAVDAWLHQWNAQAPPTQQARAVMYQTQNDPRAMIRLTGGRLYTTIIERPLGPEGGV